MPDNTFLNPDAAASLLAFSNIDLLQQTREVLAAIDYQSHVAYSHEEFMLSFAQLEYKLVIIEETFNAATIQENLSLERLQRMPMSARRHTTIILVGMNFQTLNSLQAFQHSVHAVVNYTEFSSLAQIIQKVISDNQLFLRNYNEATRRLTEGKIN